MANQYVNKVVIDGVTKIDLTGDTVSADKLLTGITAHGADGAPITGECDYNANTEDTTLAVSEALEGKTYYAPNGSKVTGTMPNRAGAGGSISTKDGEYAIQQGYHDGSGKVGIDTTEKGKLIAGNIKQGVTILGVVGSYSGEAVDVQTNKNATPTFAQQVITPDIGYDYLAQVTVAPIPVTYVDNAAGGQTCTVG